MDVEKIAKFIYNLRIKNNITQAEFASRLNVTSQAVSKWENARGIPDIEILKKISEEFSVSIDEIIQGKEIKKKNHRFHIIIIIFILIIFILTAIIIYKLNKDNSYTITTINSGNDSFSIQGVAAYSKDKKSIYISSISYIGTSCDQFLLVECLLYEVHDNIETRISESTISDEDKSTPTNLSDYLSQIEFKIDDLVTSCSVLTSNDLILVINAVNINNDTITYRIPLTLEGC